MLLWISNADLLLHHGTAGPCRHGGRAHHSLPGLTRIPDGCFDGALFLRVADPVVDSDYLAVGSLHRAGVSDVPGAPALAQIDVVAPRAAVVATDSCTDRVGRRTVAIGDYQPPILRVPPA